MSKERDAWRALPARQRAGIAVSGSKHMATLFAHLMNAKLCNMSGSAYRCHPQCIFRNGILITDHWKTWGEYDIKIANDPSEQPGQERLHDSTNLLQVWLLVSQFNQVLQPRGRPHRPAANSVGLLGTQGHDCGTL